MARQTLTKTTAPGPWPTAGVAVTETAENVTDHSAFPWTGREIILIHNTSTDTAYTWTLTAVTYLGRAGNITTESIAANAIRCIGPLAAEGFRQTDGMIYLDASNAAVKFAVITF